MRTVLKSVAPRRQRCVVTRRFNDQASAIIESHMANPARLVALQRACMSWYLDLKRRLGQRVATDLGAWA